MSVDSAARSDRRESGAATAAEPGKPLYRQIKDDLLRRVLGGEWRPGERMPGETAMAQEYLVSVGTARKAIEELVAERLVVRQRGRGTTVAQTDQAVEAFRYYRFRPDRSSEADFSTTYLSCERAKATLVEAKNLCIARGSPVVRIRRLRSHRNKPAVMEVISIGETRFPNLAELIRTAEPVSIYGFLERSFHIIVAKVSERVQVGRIDARDAEILGLEPESAVLEVVREAFDLGGDIVEFRRMQAVPGIHYSCEIA